MLNILAGAREFPADEVAALASRRSMGSEVSYGDCDAEDRDLEQFDFAGWDIALFAIGLGGDQDLRAAGGRSGLRGDRQLVALPLRPGGAADRARGEPRRDHGLPKKNIIANPNCSTAQMVVALKPLHDRARIKRVVVSTYQSVSGAGKDGDGRAVEPDQGHLRPDPGEVAQEVHQADRLQRHPPYRRLHGRRLDQGRMEDGRRDQEDPRPAIKVTATCVRVPVFVGHSEAVNIEFEDFLDEDEARDILREAPGIMVIDKREDGGYVTPVECVGDFATFISRIRQDSTIENGLNLWCVSDNLRKGAALNAVQIAESLRPEPRLQRHGRAGSWSARPSERDPVRYWSARSVR
jgi:aspartate-semialdehyde dehydrogenase